MTIYKFYAKTMVAAGTLAIAGSRSLRQKSGACPLQPASRQSRHIRRFGHPSPLFVLVTLLSTCATGQQPAAPSAGPTQQELSNAGSDTKGWLYATHDYADQKFMELKQINTDNVKSLRPVCMLFAYAQINPRHTQYQQDRNVVARGSVGIQTYESIAEIDYNVQIAPWLAVRPNLQYVVRPGGTGKIPNAMVIGLHTGMTF